MHYTDQTSQQKQSKQSKQPKQSKQFDNNNQANQRNQPKSTNQLKQANQPKQTAKPNQANQPSHEIIRINPELNMRYSQIQLDHPIYNPPHWHESIEIIYIYEGSLLSFVGDRQDKLLSNDFCIVDRNVVHATYTSENIKYLLIQIPYIFLKQYVPDMDRTRIPYVCSNTQNHITHQAEMSSLLNKLYLLCQKYADADIHVFRYGNLNLDNNQATDNNATGYNTTGNSTTGNNTTNNNTTDNNTADNNATGSSTTSNSITDNNSTNNNATGSSTTSNSITDNNSTSSSTTGNSAADNNTADNTTTSNNSTCNSSNETNTGNPRTKKSCKLTYYSLLFPFLDILFCNYSTLISEEEAINSQKYMERLACIADYVDEHYKEPITLQQGAGLLALNPEYFSRFFKKYMGVTFMDYVYAIRLKAAAHEILNTDLTIQTIMENNGFTNPKHFNKIFFEKYGVTASVFRKSRHKDNATEQL